MNGNFLNAEEISKTIKNLELETKEEKLNLDDIKTSIETLNLNYKTDNSDKLNNLAFMLNNKFKIISSIHDDNILVLNKNMETYIATGEKVSKMFDDII